jgi:hypothetical protein
VGLIKRKKHKADSMLNGITQGEIMEDKEKIEELSSTIGYVTDQKDMLGRPITVGDDVMVKYTVGSRTNFKQARILNQITGTSGFQPRFNIKYNDGVTGRKDPHRILVITEQVKKNKEEYPELYI